MSGKSVPTDNPHTVAVTPESIAPPSAETLLGRVHAKLSDVETSVTGALHKMESITERVLARVEELASRAAVPVGAAASTVAATPIVPAPIRAVAGLVAELCAECGHSELHTAGGCTAVDCTCKMAPAKK